VNQVVGRRSRASDDLNPERKTSATKKSYREILPTGPIPTKQRPIRGARVGPSLLDTK